MTMDRTLKTGGGLTKTRSVLTRAERIAKLMQDGKFDPKTDNALGLPKVRSKGFTGGAAALAKIDIDELRQALQAKSAPQD